MSKETAFYRRLVDLIEQKGKSRNQVERELGYPRNALNNYKNGREPSASRLLDLAHYLEVTPEYLAGQTNYNAAPTMEELYQALNSHQRYEMLQLCQEWLEQQSIAISSALIKSS